MAYGLALWLALLGIARIGVAPWVAAAVAGVFVALGVRSLRLGCLLACAVWAIGVGAVQPPVLASFEPVPDPAWIGASVVSVRRGEGEAATLVKLRVRIAPEGWPDCVFGVWPTAPPALATELWLRAAPTRGGICPWAYLDPEPGRAAVRQRAGHHSMAVAVAGAWVRGVRSERRVEAAIEPLRAAGLGHLFAVSGLHLVWVYGAVTVVVKALALALPWRLLRSDGYGVFYCIRRLCAFIAAVAYVWAIGAPPSAVRAVMGVAAADTLRTLVGRRPGAVALLATLLVAVLMLDLPQAQSLGFAMSVTAVAWLTPLGLLPRQLRGPAAAVLAWLGTAPWVVRFADVAWVGPVANLVGVPVFSLWLFPLAWVLELAAATGLHGVAAVAADALGFALWWLLTLCETLLEASGGMGWQANEQGWSPTLLLLWSVAPLCVSAGFPLFALRLSENRRRSGRAFVFLRLDRRGGR